MLRALAQRGLITPNSIKIVNPYKANAMFKSIIYIDDVES